MNLDGLNLDFFDREPKRRRANYVHKDPLTYYLYDDCPQFKTKYRFRKDTIRCMSAILQEDLGPKRATNNAFTAEQKLMFALSFYATGTFQYQVGDSEGASQSSMCRIISQVSTVLAKHSQSLINFCVDPVVLDKVSTGFYGFTRRMPNVAGIIDGTHIPIVAPWVNPEQYINRFRDFSISTQLVVNHRGAITFLSCRWPGSVHDSRALQESYLQDVLDMNLLGNYYLLADRGYACQTNCITPFPVATTPRQKMFNENLSKVRVKVECVIGQLKRKFPVLRSTIHYQPAVVCDIIKACGFLWNWGILSGDNAGYNPDTHIMEDIEEFDARLSATAGGTARRNALADYVWAHRR